MNESQIKTFVSLDLREVYKTFQAKIEKNLLFWTRTDSHNEEKQQQQRLLQMMQQKL